MVPSKLSLARQTTQNTSQAKQTTTTERYGVGTRPPNSPRCRTSPIRKQQTRKRGSRRQSNERKEITKLLTMKLCRSTSRQITTGRRPTKLTITIMNILYKTILLKRCRVELNGAGKMTKVKEESATATMIKNAAKAGATRNLPI